MTEITTNEFSEIRYPVITTGTFDGIHLGHLKVLSETIRLAKLYNGTPVVLTFWPHPRHVLGKGDFSLLNTLDEKKELFSQMGIEHVYFQPFTKEFSQLSSQDYVKNILVDKLGVKVLVIGYDHQFGKERSGKFETLGELAVKWGFSVERVEAFDLLGLNVSSTKIRNAIEEGKIVEANKMLGYDYFISGKVVKGNKIGRKLGYPTANIQLNDPLKIIPCDGIYAVYVKLAGELYKGMMSIGFRPTFPEQPRIRTIEVNIFDFNEEIYDQKISVFFCERLREEIKFSNIQDLVCQMEKDKIKSLEVLNNPPAFPRKLM